MRLASKLAFAFAVAAMGSAPASATVTSHGMMPPCLDGLEPRDAGPLRFAILPDRTGSERPGIFERSISMLADLEPEFILSVGDLIEGYTDDIEQVEREWDEAQAMLGKSETPVCAAPGNHDIWDEASGKIWDQRMGERYYAFRRGGALFLILNTEDPPPKVSPSLAQRQKAMKEAWAKDPQATQNRILEAVRGRKPTELPGESVLSDKQVLWAIQTLEAHSDARWTFVILHRPAWQEKPNPLAQIEQALKGRNHTVIAGHEHYLQVEKRYGMHYIVTATAGGVWLRDGPGRLDHVLLIEMGEEREARPKITSVPLVDVIAR